MDALEIVELSKAFKQRKAVNKVSFTVKEGEVFSLPGMNGAGKTTTIKVATGLLLPSEGSVKIFGYDIVQKSEQAKTVLNVSPQETAVAAKLTVRENLELSAKIYGANRTTSKNKAQAMLEKFHLSDRARDYAAKLSGGLQRRLSIAMAMITEPKPVFLDEPTLGLDVVARRNLWKYIESLKGNTTVILTTHYLEEAEALSDRIAVMREGELKGLGTAKQLKEQTGKPDFESTFLTLAGAEEEL